jgi:opacity protein-like surface antigen
MRFNITLITLLIAAGSMAQAQDFKFGVQGSLSLPQSDLKDFVDSKLGFGIGLHGAFNLKDGHVLEPRVDYLIHKGSEDDFYGYKADSTTAKQLFAGADYNYYTGGKAFEGFYVGLGAGFAQAWVDATSDHYNATASASKSSFFLALGGGYSFTPNAAIEVRYISTSWGKVEWDIPGIGKRKDDTDRSGATLNLNFLLRF